MHLIKKKLLPIYFFFALIPFISPFPLGTDTQPVALLLAMTIFAIDFLNREVKLSKFEIYFLVFALFSLVFIGLVGDFSLRSRIGLLAAFLLFYVSSNNLNYLNFRVIFLVSIVNFLGVLWHGLDPKSFVMVAEPIVRTVKISDFAVASGRGASGFAPENSFAACLSLTYIMVLFFINRFNKISRINFNFLITINIITIILTRSGTGFVFLALIFALGFFLETTKKQKIMIILLSISVFFLIINTYLANTRGGELLLLILQNPAYIFIDGSLQERWIGMHIGILNLMDYPFGLGGDAYSHVARNIIAENNLQSIYPAVRWSEGAVFNSTNTAMGKYLVEHGILFIIWIVAIVVRSVSLNPLSARPTLLGFLFLLASFSVAFPPTYILFSIAWKAKITEKEKIKMHTSERLA